jgi:putative spermidine/putrescine transport system ATP-binding protein
MATVSLDRVTKRYGEVAAVDRATFDVAEGEFLVLLGPSGCGKTTTLRLISGFADADEGSVHIGGRDVTREPPYRRNLGVVFQNYALFPHLTVFENVAFGLRRRRIDKADLAARVRRALALVKLDDFEQRLPRQLSGGQQQRVAIARALVIEPDVLLLDEPLSNLDAKLRLDVRQEIRRLQKALKITTIMVTHDQDEAMSMGDRLVVMNRGRIEQIGSPQQLYGAPRSLFVASFIGRGNFLPGRIAPDRPVFRTESGLEIACTGARSSGTTLMIRPEAVELGATITGGVNVFEGEVREAVYLGAASEILVRLQSGDTLQATAPGGGTAQADVPYTVGQRVWVKIAPAAAIMVSESVENSP